MAKGCSDQGVLAQTADQQFEVQRVVKNKETTPNQQKY